MNLILLTYENRIGSTLLAKELNSSHLVCCPESDVLMSIILNDLNFDLRPLIEDYKFREWGVNDELKTILAENISGEQRLLNLLKSYGQKMSPRPSSILIKGTDYLFIQPNTLNRLRNWFNDIHMIRVTRDPISIYNSQVRSIHSGLGIPMENNVLNFYKRFIKRKLAQPNLGNIFDVRFEVLLTNNHEIVESIYKELGLPLKERDRIHYRVGLSQSHLHIRRNIDTKLALRQQDSISRVDLLILVKLLEGKISPSSAILWPYQLFCNIQWKLRLLKRFVFSLK